LDLKKKEKRFKWGDVNLNMDFVEAYKTMVRSSVERNTKEIPIILNSIDFEGKVCLEIGCGPLARLAIKLSGFAKHITCLEKDKNIFTEATKLVKSEGLDKRITIMNMEWGADKRLPFDNDQFDVVYGAWLPHKVITNSGFLDEIARISKKYILLIIPGIEGDEPKLISIVEKHEEKQRKQYKKAISDYLFNKGYKIKYQEDILRLEFKDEQEIYEVFKCLAFKNQVLADKEKEVKRFLSYRVRNFQDGFYCLIAEKEPDVKGAVA
jgi:SAM-dependent methyltransferase